MGFHFPSPSLKKKINLQDFKTEKNENHDRQLTQPIIITRRGNRPWSGVIEKKNPDFSNRNIRYSRDSYILRERGTSQREFNAKFMFTSEKLIENVFSADFYLIVKPFFFKTKPTENRITIKKFRIKLRVEPSE